MLSLIYNKIYNFTQSLSIKISKPDSVKTISVLAALMSFAGILFNTRNKITNTKKDYTTNKIILPREVSLPSSEEEFALQLNKFMQQLDDFLLLRISSEEKRLNIAPMLQHSILALRYGHTMLNMMLHDHSKLLQKIKINDGDIIKDALVYYQYGFIHNLHKFLTYFHRVALLLNKIVVNPSHTRNEQELQGLLKLVETLKNDFLAQPEVMRHVTTLLAFSPIDSWKQHFWERLWRSDDHKQLALLAELHNDLQYDYVKINSNLNTLYIASCLHEYNLQHDKNRTVNSGDELTILKKTQDKKYFKKLQQEKELSDNQQDIPRPYDEDWTRLSVNPG